MNNKLYEYGGGGFLLTPSGTSYNSGDVVLVGGFICVAAEDIADGEEGWVEFGHVYRLPKVSAAVIGQGEMVAWDVSAGAFDDKDMTPATGDITAGAYAHKAAGNGDTFVEVWLPGIPGTVN